MQEGVAQGAGEQGCSNVHNHQHYPAAIEQERGIANAFNF